MDLEKYYTLIPPLAKIVFGEMIIADWKGIDPVLPFLEKIREERGIFVIKFDGERTGPNDNGPYTILVSGGNLADNYIRTDSFVLEYGLAYAIINYAQRCWGVNFE